MKLKYHQNTFELLSLKPQISEELIEYLNDIERQYNISIPPSIKEWYSIKESKKIIETNTFGGYDFIAFQQWQKAEQFWADNFLQKDLFKELLKEGFLLLFAVYQEVSMHWMVKLDGSDDPPVFVELDTEPPDFDWQLCANHFSEFIYELVWEFIRASKEIKLSAYTSTLTPQALSALSQCFIPLPFVDVYRNEGYRFRKDFQEIKIEIQKKCFFLEIISHLS
ncbi:hypothetical protein BGP_1388 [Beggiatoa sp. PS]|nr:hypothetical protein BGP_1388 [Beggiatoa sp. PS]